MTSPADPSKGTGLEEGLQREHVTAEPKADSEGKTRALDSVEEETRDGAAVGMSMPCSDSMGVKTGQKLKPEKETFFACTGREIGGKWGKGLTVLDKWTEGIFEVCDDRFVFYAYEIQSTERQHIANFEFKFSKITNLLYDESFKVLTLDTKPKSIPKLQLKFDTKSAMEKALTAIADWMGSRDQTQEIHFDAVGELYRTLMIRGKIVTSSSYGGGSSHTGLFGGIYADTSLLRMSPLLVSSYGDPTSHNNLTGELKRSTSTKRAVSPALGNPYECRKGGVFCNSMMSHSCPNLTRIYGDGRKLSTKDKLTEVKAEPEPRNYHLRGSWQTGFDRITGNVCIHRDLIELVPDSILKTTTTTANSSFDMPAPTPLVGGGEMLGGGSPFQDAGQYDGIHTSSASA
ncbi:unnamed protein product [Vitrella brassicaformis CCMP3155]|uniref:PH domain-containing protein n=1 Tax=Vitrella brassicaformis (strain CCMP3155) TaxID=1169540 RepID=A0A0G4FY25_VITBC|nr:unnamed protein product [Vitrella brassicaformis CCMP3155]|eukprot:CEM20054.1 unnamed protein product [Vitrella brassicaformis CCMP3155]